jgi:hypothetical protein
VVVGLLCYINKGHAQTTDEWLNQDKTQIKYLLQQVAANEIYINDIEKGIKIAGQGLQTINDIRRGEFNLHSDFFRNLENVNPAIKKLARIADIISLQVQIIKESKSAIERIKNSDAFTPPERSYLQSVVDHLIGECEKDINDLTNIITGGKLQLTDDERIERINRLYKNMLDKFSFERSFFTEAAILKLQREWEQADVDISKNLR